MYSFIEKINLFKESFIKEYGERKYRQISSKIDNSKKIRNLIKHSQIKQQSPNKNDFLYLLNEVPYFIFSKADTLAMGAILAFELWHNSLNKSYSFLGEDELIHVLEEIIESCDKIKL